MKVTIAESVGYFKGLHICMYLYIVTRGRMVEVEFGDSWVTTLNVYKPFGT